MKRIQQIWEHPLYRDQFQKLQSSEKKRIFCNHTLEHFLDVARIAWIRCLEFYIAADRPSAVLDSGAQTSFFGSDTPFSSCIPAKPVVYAAALLHDIGRCRQYADGTPHEEAGAALASIILPECGFSAEDTALIVHAILNHRLHGASCTDPVSSEVSLTSRHTACTDCVPDPSCSASSDISSTSGLSGKNAAQNLAQLIYDADKQSRCCFACQASDACRWSAEKRNLSITG